MTNPQIDKLSDASWIEYWNNNQNELHKEDGPALIHYDKNGNKKREPYCINGSRHRINGPLIMMNMEI